VTQLISGGITGGVITGVSAVRTDGGEGDSVVVTITVSTNTSVNVSDSQDASPVANGSAGSTGMAVSSPS
jgi:hypothetical protein